MAVKVQYLHQEKAAQAAFFIGGYGTPGEPNKAAGINQWQLGVRMERYSLH